MCTWPDMFVCRCIIRIQVCWCAAVTRCVPFPNGPRHSPSCMLVFFTQSSSVWSLSSWYTFGWQNARFEAVTGQAFILHELTSLRPLLIRTALLMHVSCRAWRNWSFMIFEGILYQALFPSGSTESSPYNNSHFCNIHVTSDSSILNLGKGYDVRVE